MEKLRCRPLGNLVDPKLDVAIYRGIEGPEGKQVAHYKVAVNIFSPLAEGHKVPLFEFKIGRKVKGHFVVHLKVLAPAAKLADGMLCKVSLTDPWPLP